MPVEGQWERSQTPFSRGDRRLLAVVGVVAVVVIAVVSAFYLTRSSAPSAANCVKADVASTMGGARLTVCGDAAHAFCAAHGGRDARIAAACRRDGFAADLP